MTSSSRTSEGSITTTTSGRVTASWRRIGLSSTRVYARIGAPRRSGPYSGKACALWPALSASLGEQLRSGLRALSCARMPADLDQVRLPQVRVDRARRELGAADGLDDGRSRRWIASPAVKYFGFPVRPSCVDRDRVTDELDAVDPREELSARPLADRLDDRVAVEQELGARDLLRAARALTRPARRAAACRHSIASTPAVTEEPKRDGQALEAHAFIARLLDLEPERQASRPRSAGRRA